MWWPKISQYAPHLVFGLGQSRYLCIPYCFGWKPGLRETPAGRTRFRRHYLSSQSFDGKTRVGAYEMELARLNFSRPAVTLLIACAVGHLGDHCRL
ncbi:hypothetical protein K458DRAFT_3028 [Lentithecium fluviatile CBS 122367]|uniref:Uncharacterized protein n=1 Tax=Lentithecium fluviatile CBS 122367 TaxID=1168545 RepID=A0A6G1JN00_9PLEO|nr:hypothetical protein K458DRAFT_3028 [Lentithecium fluviatile CBS 122367]